MLGATTKPWGYEIIWAKTKRYVGKIIHIRGRERLSLQYHRHKDESIYVLKGILEIDGEGKEVHNLPEDVYKMDRCLVEEGQYINIPAKIVHRFAATSGDVDIMELSTVELDDVVRLEDDYGREVEQLEKVEKPQLDLFNQSGGI